MRQLIISLFSVCLLQLTAMPSIQAQANEEAAVLASVTQLNNTIFGTKDSAAIDRLLAKQLTYGHSGGHLENRQEALHNASTNNNVYTGTKMEDFSVFFAGKTAIVRYVLFSDQTTEGTTTHLKLGMLQVWVKENKQWKLTARQAVKLPH